MSVRERARQMHTDLINQVRFAGGVASLDQLIDVLEISMGLAGGFVELQRIRLKHVNEMLGQCEERTDAIAILMVEKKSIEEFLSKQGET